MNNNESLELFFSTIDEETMETLIHLYESNDIKGLEKFLQERSLDMPKDDLLEGMKMLIEMKGMMEGF